MDDTVDSDSDTDLEGELPAALDLPEPAPATNHNKLTSDAPKFKKFLESLAPSSRRAYMSTISSFSSYCKENVLDPQSTDSPLAFMTYLHQTGSKTSSIKAKVSMIAAYFKFDKKINLYSENSLLIPSLKQWRKADTAKQAPAFSKELSKHLRPLVKNHRIGNRRFISMFPPAAALR